MSRNDPKLEVLLKIREDLVKTGKALADYDKKLRALDAQIKRVSGAKDKPRSEKGE